MIQNRFSVFLFLFVVFVAQPLFSALILAPVGTPTRAIQDLDHMLGQFHTGQNLTEEQKEQNRRLKRHILTGTFDIEELTRLAFAKHWDEFKPDERKEMIDLMISILEAQAIFSNEQQATKTKKSEKYRVVYRNEQFLNEKKTKALVKTMILIPGENIEVAVSYRLRKMGGGWKVYDIIVDQASLIENYRYQFHSIITKDGVEELRKRMKKKLEEIQIKRGKK
ncbi:MAG: hypothetical protein A3I05_01280 [Deltaproteobacteria bacterium RIFCSPLOWO2_02_FULL_44_10]|nr:MAG: hypothetical protein A3C46_00770 [Deltaproteobacteria bacterium RIFCSPHIGHO2_02_FULL_44_16]OGQ46949.1 MAG: hypothetical protein A3I05_01280 [Deltaproteobacteria bacterium RIFCSPLOWO2_02_FULL_44_10]